MAGCPSAPINRSHSDQPPPGLRRNSSTYPPDTQRTPMLAHLPLSPPFDSSHPCTHPPTHQTRHPHFNPITPATSPSYSTLGEMCLETLLSHGRTKATQGSLNLCTTEAGSYFQALSLRVSPLPSTLGFLRVSERQLLSVFLSCLRACPVTDCTTHINYSWLLSLRFAGKTNHRWSRC